MFLLVQRELQLGYASVLPTLVLTRLPSQESDCTWNGSVRVAFWELYSAPV